jgi:hypothetical protein
MAMLRIGVRLFYHRDQSAPIPSTVRADDLLRHLQDLQSGTYEGAVSRGAKEVVYRLGINMLRPVALEIREID